MKGLWKAGKLCDSCLYQESEGVIYFVKGPDTTTLHVYIVCTCTSVIVEGFCNLNVF